jgi:hypothetical protein
MSDNANLLKKKLKLNQIKQINTRLHRSQLKARIN